MRRLRNILRRLRLPAATMCLAFAAMCGLAALLVAAVPLAFAILFVWLARELFTGEVRARDFDIAAIDEEAVP